MVSSSGMPVPLKTDLRFPVTGQQGHGSRNIQMVVVTNLGSISYLVKGKAYVYEKAVTLFNEAVNANNEAKDLKGLQRAADYFLKNCYKVGIDYDDR